jgi:hypothetical protein
MSEYLFSIVHWKPQKEVEQPEWKGCGLHIGL